ncbi:MAG: hypothetical protein ACYC26_13450 [Phycisphaerales bacterium]
MNSANASRTPDLGPVVFVCRRASQVQTLRAQGFRFSWLLYYVLCPLFMIPYLAMMAAMVPFLILGYTVKQAIGPAFVPVFVLFYLLIAYFNYVRPRRDCLVLHERGMRIRLGLKHLHVSFDNIDCLFPGRIPTKLEKGFRKILRFMNPHQARWMNSMDGTTLTIITKNSSVHTFKALFTRFAVADLNQLLQQLTARNLLLQSPP